MEQPPCQVHNLLAYCTANGHRVNLCTRGRGTAIALARGFILAEVVSYDGLVAAGCFAEAQQRGLLHLEGRDCVVEDGSILETRFDV